MNNLLEIANKVNRMTTGMAQLRIKEMEKLYNQEALTFEHQVELNFLCIKVLTIYK